MSSVTRATLKHYSCTSEDPKQDNCPKCKTLSAVVNKKLSIMESILIKIKTEPTAFNCFRMNFICVLLIR